MGDYWDTYGTGDAWCDRFGHQVDPRTFPDEDSLRAAGYHHVTQAGAKDWVSRELGDVPYDPDPVTFHGVPVVWNRTMADHDWPHDAATVGDTSELDTATAYGIVWGRPSVVPVPHA